MYPLLPIADPKLRQVGALQGAPAPLWSAVTCHRFGFLKAAKGPIQSSDKSEHSKARRRPLWSAVTCHRFGFLEAVTASIQSSDKSEHSKVRRRPLWSAVTCHRFGFFEAVEARSKAPTSRSTPKRSGAPLECGDLSPLWFLGGRDGLDPKLRQVGALQSAPAPPLECGDLSPLWILRGRGKPASKRRQVGALQSAPAPLWSAVTCRRFGFCLQETR